MTKNVSTSTSCIARITAEACAEAELLRKAGRIRGTCHQGGSTAASIHVMGSHAPPCQVPTVEQRRERKAAQQIQQNSSCLVPTFVTPAQ